MTLKTCEDCGRPNKRRTMVLTVLRHPISINRARARANRGRQHCLRCSKPGQTTRLGRPTPIKSESGSESLISNSSAAPSKPSTETYRLPRNVREFASQANRVGTAILNGQIDLDTARAYSAVARTVAQALTAETTHARFLKTAPDLTFVEEDED